MASNLLAMASKLDEPGHGLWEDLEDRQERGAF